MRQFVTNNGTDRPVIQRIIRLRIEERGLENAGRKYDLVIRWRVIGFHGWRSHLPFAAVDGLADLRNITLLLERHRLANIQEI